MLTTDEIQEVITIINTYVGEWASSAIAPLAAEIERRQRGPFTLAEAHRLAHKLRDPKFYTARTKRAVNSRGAL